MDVEEKKEEDVEIYFDKETGIDKRIGTEKEDLRHTLLIGRTPESKIKFNAVSLGKKFFWESTILKKVKVWYGKKKDGDKLLDKKVVIAMQFWYKDYVGDTTNYDNDKIKYDLEKKEFIMTDIEGPEGATEDSLKERCDEVKEIEVNYEEYFSKIDIHVDPTEKDIIYLKFYTSNDKKFLEVGDPKEKYDELEFFDQEDIVDAHITCFRGFKDKNQLTSFGYCFMSRIGFFTRLFKDYFGLMTLFSIVKDETGTFTKEKEKVEKIVPDSDNVKLLKLVANLPKPAYNEVLKYLLKVKKENP